MQQVNESVSDTGNQGSIKELLKTDKYLRSIKLNWGLTTEVQIFCANCDKENYQGECSRCGSTEKTKKNIWVESDEGIMNKRGVDNYISTISTFVDRNQITSDFSKKEIVSIMEDFHEQFAEEVFWEWHDYGIDNKPQGHKVVNVGTNIVWALFKRAQGGETLDSISGMGKDVQKSVQKQEEDDNYGVLGRLS